jgi:hypothetical protein
MLNDGAAIGRTTRIFFAAFVFACFLFWWLPSIIYRLFLGVSDPVQNWALWVSVLAFGTFAVGYSVSPSGVRAFFEPFVPRVTLSSHVMDACESFAYQATVLIALPAFLVALQFSGYRLSVDYGWGENMPFAYQIVLYIHLFFAFLFLGVAKSILQNKRRIIIASILVILPRLIVSLRWGRFVLAQALVPIVFIALARGWVRFSGKRIIVLGLLAAFIVFVPALTRGDNFLGRDELVNFLWAGSTLHLLQNYMDLDLKGKCPPLLVSITAKTIPYSLLGICTMNYKGVTGIPAILDRIITEDDLAAEGSQVGTGSNYLLELYLTGGLSAIIFGSMFLGFTSRCFMRLIGQRSAFAGIWAECLSRALFAPRMNWGYVYERIPSLVLATLAVLWLAWLADAQAGERAANRLHRHAAPRGAGGLP